MEDHQVWTTFATEVLTTWRVAPGEDADDTMQPMVDAFGTNQIDMNLEPAVFRQFVAAANAAIEAHISNPVGGDTESRACHLVRGLGPSCSEIFES